MFFLKPKQEQMERQKAVYSKFFRQIGLSVIYFVTLKGMAYYFKEKK